MSTYHWNWKNYPFIDPLSNSQQQITVSSPYPGQYVALIKQGQGFSANLQQLSQVRPGDIMVWWVPGSKDHEHTLQVADIDFGAGRPYPAGYPTSHPQLIGSTLYPVHVIDSSADLHTNDTRNVNVNGTMTHIAGIGQGDIGVLVAGDGSIIGCTWSLPSFDDQTQPTNWLNFVNKNLKWAELSPAFETPAGHSLSPFPQRPGLTTRGQSD